MNLNSRPGGHSLLFSLGAILLMLPITGCGLSGKRSAAADRDRGELLSNGGFEASGGWQRSGPPGYGQYAELALDDQTHKSGRRSARVSLLRHPRGRSGSILHGWTQSVHPPPRGRVVRLSGDVRMQGKPVLKFGLQFEVSVPRNGRTLLTFEFQPPPPDGKFHRLSRRIILPDDLVSLEVYAGLSDIGDAWFDNLSLSIVR